MAQDTKRVIAIGRQFGSGGREIGRRVAAQLGYGYYDKELLDLAAQKSGLHPDVIRKAEEQPTNSLLYSIATGTAALRGGLGGIMHTPLTDQVYRAQSDIIKELAQKENCVIIGRCADYVLDGHPGLLSVFIYGSMETKIKRCVAFYGISQAEAAEEIRKIDKRRCSYYQFFTDRSWGAAQSYNLSLDIGAFDVDGCVEMILQAQRLSNVTAAK